MRHYVILFLLLCLLSYCKKECEVTPEPEKTSRMEGRWWMQNTGAADYRLIFLEGQMHRDRFQNGKIDENLTVDYRENGDTLFLSNYFNLIARSYIMEFSADSSSVYLTDITHNAPFGVSFGLEKR